MSPEEFFKKGVSQISAGKRIRRREKSIFKQRRNSSAVKSKTVQDGKSEKKEKIEKKEAEIRAEKEYRVDVTI